MRNAVWVASAALVVITACYSAPVETPPTTTTEVTDYSVLASGRQIDILFLIDDSGSMASKQTELRNRFPQLISRLEQFANEGKQASYHIGVVTSDLGGVGVSCGKNRKGALQALGAAAAEDCQAPVGKPFIEYNQVSGQNNLPAGQDLAKTFQCMAAVGTEGCGYEQQLEAVYKALKEPPEANAGFLREDALLAVVFVTDEDDCSLPPGSDLFTGSSALPPDGYGAANLSFRCTQFGISCGDPLQSIPSGENAWSHCEPTPGGGKLLDVQRYINLFTQPRTNGGIKDRPEKDVILIGVAGDADKGLHEFLGNTKTYEPCSKYDGTTCSWLLDRSCRSTSDPTWVGDPAIRIAKVVQAAAQNNLTSVCADSYQPAIDSLADLIQTNLNVCLDRPLADPDKPDCIVEDSTPRPGERDEISEVFSCTAREDQPPCWRVQEIDTCPPVENPISGQPERLGIFIDRGGYVLPDGTHTRVECATVAAHSTP